MSGSSSAKKKTGIGKESKSKPSICFVAHNALPVFLAKDTKNAGGVEIQVPLMARWFAERGYSVSLVTWNEDVSEKVHDNVRLVPMCRKQDGVPILRFFYPRWSSLITALKEADADIVYYNTADQALGQIALWARTRTAKIVFSLATSLSPGNSIVSQLTRRELYLFRYGLNHCDLVLSQTEEQHNALKSIYNTGAEVVPMPCLGLSSKRVTQPNLRVLWIGRISPEKRVEWLLEAASKLPEIFFDIVGGGDEESSYYQSFIERACDLPNVTLTGRVPHADIGDYYARADLLCCTSIFEGFPNTFLEAFSIGVPVITSFDPDHIVKQEHLGKVFLSCSELVSLLGDFKKDASFWAQAGSNAASYFEKRHQLDNAMTRFAVLFESLHNNS